MDGLHAARPGGDLLCRGADDALREHGAVRARDLDAVACGEAALATDDADGEQALPLPGDRAARAFVDHQPAFDALAEAQPELERRRRVGAGGEARAARLARDDGAEHVLTAA